MANTPARLLLVLVAYACAVAPAHAATCYQVLDRKDAIIYRDRTAPWDLSTGEAGSRLAVPPAGERLMFFEADLCAPAASGRYATFSDDRSGDFFTSVREMGVGRRPGVGPGVKSDRGSAARQTQAAPAAKKTAATRSSDN